MHNQASAEASSRLLVQVISGQALLVEAARLLDSAFAGHPTLELYFVMLVCPLLMNLIQVQLSLSPFRAEHMTIAPPEACNAKWLLLEQAQGPGSQRSQH